MELKKFVISIRGIQLENLGHRYTNLALVAAVIAMSIAVITKKDVVTIVPPTLVERAWVDSGSAAQAYTESWALYVAQTLGNVTPGTSDMVRKSIEPLLDASIYQSVVNSIEKQVQDFRRDRVTLRFEPKKVVRERDNEEVFFVTGRSVMEGPTGEKKSEDRTYEISIKIKNYQPKIVALSTYQGGPRTSDVVERQERMEEKQREGAQRRKQ